MQKKMHMQTYSNSQHYLTAYSRTQPSLAFTHTQTQPTFANQFQSPVLSPRTFSQKTSLKNANSTATENSTTCQSTQQGLGVGKKSLRTMLVSTRSRNHHSENCISLRYSDIQEKMEQQEERHTGSFFMNFFCRMRSGEEEQLSEGCCCQPKCLWMDHWLKMAKQSGVRNSAKRPHHSHNLPTMSYQHTPQRSGGLSYSSYSSSPPSQQTVQQIRKDLHRTQPNNKAFRSQKMIERLESLLLGYSGWDQEVEYVQGMNIIASVLIYHNSPETPVHESLEILKFLMVQRRFRDIYLNDFDLVHRLGQSVINTLRMRCNDLYRHVVEVYGVDLRIFIIGWLIPMLGNIVPLELMHLVVNNYLEKGLEGLMRVIIAMLLFLRQDLLEIHDETEIMEQLSVQVLSQGKLPWEQIILSSRNVKVLHHE